MSHSKNYVTDNRLNRCFTIHQEWFSPIPTKEDWGGGGRDGGGINEFRQLERRGNKFMQRLQYAKYLTFWIVIPHFLFLGVWLLDWLQAVSWPLPWTSRAVFDLNFTFPPPKKNKKQKTGRLAMDFNEQCLGLWYEAATTSFSRKWLNCVMMDKHFCRI